MLAQTSCRCGFQSETECYFSNEKNSVCFSFTFPFQMLSSHRISPLWSIRPTSFCSQPRVLARTTHYMLHTLRYTVNTALTIGKYYESLVCYTGDFGWFLSEGKELSRIILVDLMRTQDKMEHSGTWTVMALSSRTCRTISLPFGTLRWNENMNEEDTFTIN